MVVHQNITNLAGYFHFLNVRKIPYVIFMTRKPPVGTVHDSELRGKPRAYSLPTFQHGSSSFDVELTDLNQFG